MKHPDIERYYLHALDLVLGAEFSRAAVLLEKLRTAAPGDPRFVYANALCLFMLGRAEQARLLCERLTGEFNDPRGQRLQNAFLDAAAVPKKVAPVYAAGSGVEPPPPARRRRVALMAVLSVFLLLGGCMWYAYPVLVRLQEQGGQLPAITGQAPLVAFEDPAASSPPPSMAGVSNPDTESSNRSEADSPSLAEYLRNMGLKMGIDAWDAAADAAATSPDKPAWKQRLEDLELSESPRGPVASVVELQPYRTSQTLGNDAGDSVTLTDLNPLVGAWHVLEFTVGGKKQAFHLELFPLADNHYRRPKLALYADGLAVVLERGTEYFPLWSEPGSESIPPGPADRADRLNAAPVLSEVFKTVAAARSPMGLLCNNMVLVRQQRPGSTSRMELATDVLRETRVGDWLVETLKPMMIRPPETAESQASMLSAPSLEGGPESPLDALVAPTFAKLAHKPRLLGIETEAGDQKNLQYGHWYKTARHPGVFVSVLAPAAIAPSVLASYTDRVDSVGSPESGSQESGSVAYMLAINMDRYGFGYAVGAEHPAVNWSGKAKPVPGLPGPDGFGTQAPLATIGALPPCLVDVVAGVFAGGFKREHGAFSSGPLSKVNHNSHFGFVENGVVLSRLNPGLATAVIAPDGSLDLLTWPEDGERDFRYILHARQNGVPIIDGVDADGISIPGTLVNRPGEGAWSGNANGRLLTIRSGIGIQEHDGHRFLLLGYFTGATPNAMARTYQAYRCRYAMALDMNAPGLSYSALYCRDSTGKITGAEYLIKEMSAANGGSHLRFLQTNDTRDCFYLFHK